MKESKNYPEGRNVLGTFRSVRMQVLYRSCQDDRLRVMLVLVHTDITPPHTPQPVFRRIGERKIPYSWRALSGKKKLRFQKAMDLLQNLPFQISDAQQMIFQIKKSQQIICWNCD
ncbi:uncharacterized protein TNCV_2477521 [Trichonephila clavipes]|nr:uncharacterized protein TNCV_2477521 [Trichonephila clavipes]